MADNVNQGIIATDSFGTMQTFQKMITKQSIGARHTQSGETGKRGLQAINKHQLQLMQAHV